MIALIIILVIVVLLALWGVGAYNTFIKLRTRVENAWAQIEVQLQRRHDLIPNLVSTVKGYAEHEKSTFDAVVKARQVAVDAKGIADQAAAENMLSQTLRSLFAVAEAYPDLKANQNFLDLQKQLQDTEDKLSYSRQSYNDVVMRFNTALQVFPSNIIAGIFHFEKKDMYDAVPEADAAPQVQF